jgi:hypothetical protein
MPVLPDSRSILRSRHDRLLRFCVAGWLIILPDRASFLAIVDGSSAGILLALMQAGPAIFDFEK